LYKIEDIINKVHCADCLTFMRNLPDKCVDLVLTDPPYPDYHTELYGFQADPINYLARFKCKQLVFWSAKERFLLDYTAIHIWDKKCGVGSMYERIFERNGGKNYRVYNNYLINSTVAAKYSRDIFYNHPSQKPIKLIKKLLVENSNDGDTIFDPFLGSGTTAVACKELNRNFIGVEINPEYCKIAEKRLFNTQGSLF